ncbi:hypothetical protein SAY87_025092 [Trapa incisa]|uniref:X8 domain-containing protein n=1 Tax=Trapa incisa TaxID=236973 RepID=A0AAN7JFI6_9MYRT|nr:hypothetical protein SAY87_025092 [Trapa incisa]
MASHSRPRPQLWRILRCSSASAVDGATWCVARSDASQQALQRAMDYACGSGKTAPRFSPTRFRLTHPTPSTATTRSKPWNPAAATSLERPRQQRNVGVHVMWGSYTI